MRKQIKQTVLASIGAIAALGATTAFGYNIESEITCEAATADCAGLPETDQWKVTITDDGTVGDSFSLSWTVPKEATSGAPFDLTASAQVTVTEFTANGGPNDGKDTITLKFDFDNTSVYDAAVAEFGAGNFNPDGLNSLLAFGINVYPDDPLSASLLNDSTGSNSAKDWQVDTTQNFAGGFQKVDVCIWPDQNNNCAGGNVANGLVAGEVDSVFLTLTGEFNSSGAGPLSVMLSDFALKMQGQWGSFETGGFPCVDPNDPNCGGGGGSGDPEVPEPGSLALMMLGATIAYRRKWHVIKDRT